MNLNLAQSLSTPRLTVDNPYGALARLTIRGILKGDIGTRRMTLRIKGTTREVARQLTRSRKSDKRSLKQRAAQLEALRLRASTPYLGAIAAHM